MLSPTHKLALAVALSIAVHSLLFIKGEPIIPPLSQTTIIHARLDKQDREIIQEAQMGQMSQQDSEVLSEATEAVDDVPEQPLVEKKTLPVVPIKPEPISEPISEPIKEEIISSSSDSEQTVAQPPEEMIEPPLEKPELEVPEPVEPEPVEPEPVEPEPVEPEPVELEKEALVEEATIKTAPPTPQQDKNVSRDSRAQVEALEGSEDPTHTSYRRVLKQYLTQRLEIKSDNVVTVRLKIKIEYGSIATSINIIESSGDTELDNQVKKAALAANPYPKIPKEIGSSFEFSPTFELGTNKFNP